MVQDQPVPAEGSGLRGLRRGLLALLTVCHFAVLVHGGDGPPATVGGGNMVGGRHDRAVCACGGEERSAGREGEGEGEREKRQKEGRERGRERELQAERSSIIRLSSPQLRAAAPQRGNIKMTESTAHACTALHPRTNSHFGLYVRTRDITR